MPGSIVGTLKTLAKKKNNYVATAAAFSESVLRHKAVVPAGKRWFLIGGYVKRDASETIIVTARDTSDNNILKLLDETASTSGVAYPEADFQFGSPTVLDAGEYIDFTFGGNQGAGAYLSCIVLEVDV